VGRFRRARDLGVIVARQQHEERELVLHPRGEGAFGRQEPHLARDLSSPEEINQW
jgi:hypothetical protein